MRYFGGKQRISKPLSEYINKQIGNSPFYDLFCGSCNVITKIEAKERYANDLNPYLIQMWKELQNGRVFDWQSIDENLYKSLKDNPDQDPALASFVLFGCSFSGKWKGGYARDSSERNYVNNAFNSTMKKVALLNEVEFSCLPYNLVTIKEGSVVYCDIPYKNTTQYSAVGSFNHAVFYEWAKATSQHSVLLISEYAENVPPDAHIVWEYESKQDMRSKDGSKKKTTEVLFTYK